MTNDIKQKLVADIHSDLVILTEKMNRALEHGILTEFALPMKDGQYAMQVRFIQEINPIGTVQ